MQKVPKRSEFLHFWPEPANAATICCVASTDPQSLVDQTNAANWEVEALAQQYASLGADEQRQVVEDLAERARKGNTRALDLLLTILDGFRLVVPPVRRLIADNGAVEEVVQDVLVIVAHSIEKFRGESAFRTWMSGVARNQAMKHLRSASRLPEAMAEVQEQRPSRRVSSMVSQRSLLVEALEELPEIYQQAVVLRDIEQLSYDEIATQLNIELNTVRSRLSRGRALLAQKLERL